MVDPNPTPSTARVPRASGHNDGGPHRAVSPGVVQGTAMPRFVPGKWYPGRRFGRYELLRRLGVGFQAQVWKALQLEPVIEVVALKLLSPRLAAETSRLAQFRREAELGARLASPWLLPTYEFGEIDGTYFMAMPLVDGGTLADILARPDGATDVRPVSCRAWWTTLTPTARPWAMVRVIARIARALHVAHQSGFAHRDIKPANILVDRYREDRVFLCDFGLGIELAEAATEPRLTGTGTPLYMAPEKLRAQPVDEIRCDIYALGVTLFQALTGVHPFEVPEHVPKNEWAEYLTATAPRRLRDVSSGLPAVLEAIVNRATAREASERYSSAGRLADDLEHCAREARSPAVLARLRAPR